MNLQVSVYGMAEMSDEEVASALRDAVRVLKPGKVQSFPQFPVTIIMIISEDIKFSERLFLL